MAKSFEKWRRRVLGLAMPVTVDAVCDAFKELKWMLEELEKRSLEGELEAAKQGYRRQVAERKGRETDDACEEGYWLFQIYCSAGPNGWTRHVKELGVDAKTGWKKVSLAKFRRDDPEAYHYLRVLGPNTLYRLLCVAEALAEMKPGVKVQLTRGKVLVKDMTREELMDRVRELCPRPPADYWGRARVYGRLSRNAKDRAQRLKQPLAPELKRELMSLFDNALRDLTS